MKLLVVLAFGIFFADSVPVEDEESEDGKICVEPEYLDALLEEHRYEEFSELMGINNSRLAMPRNTSDKNDPAYVDPSFIKDLFEGDILLTPAQEESARQGIIFGKYPSYRWAGGVVPYSISSDFSAADRYTIEECIKSWNAMFSGCITFVSRTNQNNYVFYFPGDGCYANLGCVGGQQPISLSPNGCMRRGTVLHEMEHTCGMLHEQSRPDRDKYVNVIYANIESSWHPQYKQESASTFGNYGSYECGSVMHYPINAPGSSKPAFSWSGTNCTDTSKVGQRLNLTATDVGKVKGMYGCK